MLNGTMTCLGLIVKTDRVAFPKCMAVSVMMNR